MRCTYKPSYPVPQASAQTQKRKFSYAPYQCNTRQKIKSTPENVKIPCLFTKDIIRKRKRWSDGVLKVTFDSNSSSFCSLYEEGSSKCKQDRLMQKVIFEWSYILPL